MKNYFKIIAILLFAFIFSKCTSDAVIPDAKELGLEQQDSNSFIGKIRIQNSEIRYSVKAKSELVFTVIIEINKKSIQADINYQNESLFIDGHNIILTEKEKQSILTLGGTISNYLLETKKGEILMTEYTLLSLMEYWAKSPPDYTYTKRVIEAEVNTTNLKSRNEGITCIRKNTYVNAEYDDSRGNHSDRIRVGSKARDNYGCMGRCGGDCGRWWIPSAWTKDCLDHDQCSNVNFSSGGGGDRNCGDEFNEAADDYVFGVLRGCRG
ncbi:hypothetical protein [Aquimarina algiphila]|uniref:hypothetical protein n=1 Tax=Aquimarina algiphila TaxID=2047982 RepID=UPI002491ED6F|nr:hypothetical protein [Aquimarina algiphila]